MRSTLITCYSSLFAYYVQVTFGANHSHISSRLRAILTTVFIYFLGYICPVGVRSTPNDVTVCPLCAWTNECYPSYEFGVSSTVGFECNGIAPDNCGGSYSLDPTAFLTCATNNTYSSLGMSDNQIVSWSRVFVSQSSSSISISSNNVVAFCVPFGDGQPVLPLPYNVPNVALPNIQTLSLSPPPLAAAY